MSPRLEELKAKLNVQWLTIAELVELNELEMAQARSSGITAGAIVEMPPRPASGWALVDESNNQIYDIFLNREKEKAYAVTERIGGTKVAALYL